MATEATANEAVRFTLAKGVPLLAKAVEEAVAAAVKALRVRPELAHANDNYQSIEDIHCNATRDY